MKKTLVFIDDESDLLLLPGGGESEHVFVCSTLATRMKLEKSGLEVRCWDDFLAPEQAQEAQNRIYDILQTWYLRAGKDISLFRECSLGNLAATLPVYFLTPGFRHIVAFQETLENLQPDAVVALFPRGDTRLKILLTLCGRRGISLEHHETAASASIEKYPLISINQARLGPLRHVIELAAAFFPRNALSKDRKIVYILDNGANRFIWRHWLDNKSLRNKIGIGFIKQFPPGRRTPALIRSGAATLDAFRHKLITDEKEALSLISLSFAELFGAEEWAAKFRFRGDNFADIFTEPFKKLVEDQFPTIATMLLSFRRQLVGGGNVSVLVFNDVLPQAAALIQAAREKGIPSFMYEHGILPNYSHRENLLRSAGRTDRLLVWGSGQKENFTTHSPCPAVTVVGAPPEKVPIAKRAGGDSVLVLGNSRSSANVAMRPTEEENFILNVLNVLKSHREQKVIIKIHPTMSNIRLYDDLRPFLAADIDVVFQHHTDLTEAMLSAKYVIGPPSTSALTAASLGRPYYCIHVDSYPPATPFDGAHGTVARSYTELEQNIRESKHLKNDEILKIFTFCENISTTGENIFRAIIEG